jgi:hypothetical protein
MAQDGSGGGSGSGIEVQAAPAPGQALDLPVRTASAPAPKQGLTGKQEHCPSTPPTVPPDPSHSLLVFAETHRR